MPADVQAGYCQERGILLAEWHARTICRAYLSVTRTGHVRCKLHCTFDSDLARYVSIYITAIWLLLQLLFDRSEYQSRSRVESRRVTLKMEF
jgi:hypothetical protein